MFKTTLGLGLGSAKSSDLNVSKLSTGKKITACLSSHFREINLNVELFVKQEYLKTLEKKKKQFSRKHSPPKSGQVKFVFFYIILFNGNSIIAYVVA
jgi:hypothetical protein